MSFEERLRQSLEARANDVSPDPALFSAVQSRIRRGRTFRFALAGVAATLAIGGAAIAAPALINRRIEFEPPAPATQPAPEATVTTAVVPPGTEPAPSVGTSTTTMVFADDHAIYSMAIDGESAEVLVPSPCPQDATCDYDSPGFWNVAARPGGAAGDSITAVGVTPCAAMRYTGSDQQMDVELLAALGIPKPSSPCSGPIGGATAAFSPDGRHLAVVAFSKADQTWSLYTVDWTDDGPVGTGTSFDLGLDPDAEVRLEDWTWLEDSGEAAEGQLFLKVDDQTGTHIVIRDIERQGDGAVALASSDPGMLEHSGPSQPAGSDVHSYVVAYASGAEDPTHEYTIELEIQCCDYGVGGVQLVRQNLTTGDTSYVDLPPSARPDTPQDVARLWVSAAGDDVVLGNGKGRAWSAHWSGDQPPAITRLSARIIDAELLATPTGAPEATPTAAATLPVEVHFGMEGAEACLANQQVTRMVAGPGVARAALTELLEGPNSRESNEGIVSPFTANTAGLLNDIIIVDGRAEIDFSAELTQAVDTDACTKSAIIDSLDKTLSQFSTITSTLYTLDGDSEAWRTWIGQDSELGHDAPQAVVATSEEIYAAARDHDWATLRRLSGSTSCTMSDQPEPCVPYWKDQEANGEDPLGLMVQVLSEAPTNNPDSPSMWVWPPEWADPEASGYNGPRIGIDEDGAWRYFVQQGG